MSSVEPTSFTKVCNACGEEKPDSAFYHKEGNRDGRNNRCKECERGNRRRANAMVRPEVFNSQGDPYQAAENYIRACVKQSRAIEPDAVASLLPAMLGSDLRKFISKVMDQIPGKKRGHHKADSSGEWLSANSPAGYW